MSKWEMVKLGSIYEIKSGGTPNKNFSSYYENGKVPWIRTGDLQKKYIKEVKTFITNEGLKNSSAKLFPPKTVLVAMYGATIGACSILKFEASTNQACAAFLPNNKVNETFLYYFFISSKSYLVNKGNGGAQPNISASILKSIAFPLPPLDEQQKIASRLDAVAELLNLRRKKLQKLDELIKANFYEMFGDPVLNDKGWKKEQFINFAALLNGRAYKQSELLKEGKTPVLRVGNFFNSNKWYFSNLDLDVNKYCDAGDLLYAWSASFGPKIWQGPRVIYHYHIWKVLLTDKIEKKFAFYLLYYATESLKNQTHGIAMMHLTKSGMEKTEFILPELTKQQEFSSLVEKIEEQKTLVQQSLDETQLLFDSLMSEYFD